MTLRKCKQQNKEFEAREKKRNEKMKKKNKEKNGIPCKIRSKKGPTKQEVKKKHFIVFSFVETR